MSFKISRDITLTFDYTMADALDKIIDAHAAQPGPSRKPRGDVGYAEFEKMINSTPLFMQETPDSSNDDPVLEALKTLVFEGDGDGKFFDYPTLQKLTTRGCSELQEPRERAIRPKEL